MSSPIVHREQLTERGNTHTQTHTDTHTHTHTHTHTDLFLSLSLFSAVLPPSLKGFGWSNVNLGVVKVEIKQSTVLLIGLLW